MRRMPSIALLLMLVAVAAAPPGGLAARPAKPSFREASGVISLLRPSRIRVGRLSCAIRSPVTGLRRFAAGERAAITCRSGSLTRIRRLAAAPPPAAAATAPAAPTTAAPTTTTTATPTQAGGGRLSSPSFPTSATGTITAIDASGVTVGGVTCPFSPGFYAVAGAQWHVGDQATIGCGNGVVLIGPPG